MPEYVDSVQQEMRIVVADAASDLPPAHTLYFGGGTPSLLEAGQIKAIIEAARDVYRLKMDAEVTLEVNPGTVDAAKLAAFRDAGVNRLSIGVQSAQPFMLEMFERSHTFEEAAETFTLSRGEGFNSLSVDLIYGVPGQTRAQWQETLHAVLAWRPDHVSLYGLTVEPGTPMARWVAAGTLSTPDSDLAADMFEDARHHAAEMGMRHYEISNWARPGHESQHNHQYWLNRPFLGFGPGAHGAARGMRYWTVRGVADYIARINMGEAGAYPMSPAVYGSDTISREMTMAESVILGLRLLEQGVNRAAFEQRYGCTLDEIFGDVIPPLVDLGMLRDDTDALRLTERATLVSNQIFLRFLPDS